MHVQLTYATDQRINELAAVTCSEPVEPLELGDHAWLYGDPADVYILLHASRDRRISAGGDAWVILADEKPAGMLTAKYGDDWAETWSFVSSSFQRNGVASAARARGLLVFQERSVSKAVSTARVDSGSSAVSKRLGYTLVGTETRSRSDGLEVELERYELELATWTCPKSIVPASID